MLKQTDIELKMYNAKNRFLLKILLVFKSIEYWKYYQIHSEELNTRCKFFMNIFAILSIISIGVTISNPSNIVACSFIAISILGEIASISYKLIKVRRDLKNLPRAIKYHGEVYRKFDSLYWEMEASTLTTANKTKKYNEYSNLLGNESASADEKSFSGDSLKQIDCFMDKAEKDVAEQIKYYYNL